MAKKSTKSIEADVGAQTQNDEQRINCPVSGCRKNLLLQPHPRKAGRLVAHCRCQHPVHKGVAVYETSEVTDGSTK